MNMCCECKWLSLEDRICTREDGNRKASPYVGACIDNFERQGGREMTEQEELCKAAQDAYPNWVEAQCHFIDGGHWQKERLINKACLWLRRTQPKAILPDTTIERFRRAMED